MKRFIVSAALPLLVALVLLLPLHSARAEIDAAALVYGMQSYAEPLSLDPKAYGYADEPLLIEMQIYEGLARWDANGNPVPAIASSWKAKTPKTWIFNLRQNVYFHNGRQVKAQDFVYSWYRVKNCTKCASFWMDIVKSVTAVSNFKLKVVLNYPYAEFPTMLPLPPFAVVPAEAATNLKKNPVGAGPFAFKSWLKGNRIQLTKFGKYYSTKASFKTLVFQFFPNIDAEYAAFTNATLQVSEVSPSAWQSVKADPNVLAAPILGTHFMLVDTAVYSDVNVRCGIQRAVDANVIRAASQWDYDQPPLATGMVTPGKGSFNDDDISAVYNPTIALSLLSAAGWTDTNSDGILDNGAGQNLTATLPSFSSGNPYTATHAIGNMLANIGGLGVGLQVNYVSYPGPGTVYYTGWISDYPDPDNDLYAWLHPNGFLNSRSHYNNPAVTLKLDTARATLDQSTRYSLQHDAEEIAIETDCVVSPLFRVTNIPHIKASQVNNLIYISSMGEAAYLNQVTVAP